MTVLAGQEIPRRTQTAVSDVEPRRPAGVLLSALHGLDQPAADPAAVDLAGVLVRAAQAYVAVDAFDGGLLAEQIIPVTVAGRQGESVMDLDAHPRADTTRVSLPRLKPMLLKQDPQSTMTPGNITGHTDVASTCIATTPRLAGELGLRPLVRLASWATAQVPPNLVDVGPAPATNVALRNTRCGLETISIDGGQGLAATFERVSP